MPDFSPNTELSLGSIIDIQTDIPRDIKVFDLFFDIATLSWQSWQAIYYFSHDQKGKSKDPNKGPLSQTIVTQDFLRMSFLMQRLFHAKKPVLFLGPTGTGKTTLLRHFLQTQDNENKMTHLDIISCSQASTSSKIQSFIEQRLQSVSRFLTQPAQGKHIVFMFDDINMTYKDRWGHMSMNELIRQWLTYKGWHHTKSCAFRKVKEINLAATMTLRTDKEVLDERLGWNFATVGFWNFSGCHIELIYTRILTSALTTCTSKKVQQNAPTMILKASQELLTMLKKSIAVAPTNFLQMINSRHLLMLLNGIIDAPSDQFNEFEDVANLWIHEVCRVVLDRFVDPNQKQTLFSKVKKVASGAFKIREKFLIGNMDRVLFTYGSPKARTQYMPVPHQESVLQAMMQDALEEFNARSTGKQQLDVVFFHSVIEKVIKINRSMQCIGGHTILVAHQGSGSFELVKIAISLSDFGDFSLYEKDSELEEDWRLQIKDIMSRVINERKTRFVVHVEERDLSTKGILSALNALVAHNEIFEFFSKEELDLMVGNLRQTIGPLLVADQTQAQMVDKFRQIIKEELTVLVQLSPRLKVLLSDLRQTQHLVNASTIIQFGDWNRAGFQFMAKKYFQSKQAIIQGGEDELQEEDDVHIEHLDKVVLCQIEMHQDCELNAIGYLQETGHFVYISPQLFENFIRTYKRLLKMRQVKLKGYADRFKSGYEGILKCLRETEAAQEELSQKAPKLVKRQGELEQMLDGFKQRHNQINQQRDLLMKKGVEVNVELDEATQIQQDCEKAFKAKVPLFIEANEGLRKITKQQIEEVQKIRQPSQTLLTLSKAICIIMKVPPVQFKSKENNFKAVECYWTAFQGPKLLADFRIIQRFTEIDPASIKEDTISLLEELLKDESLSEAKVFHSSRAARGLYSWLNAIRTYFFTYRDSAPIRNKLLKADIQLKKIKAKRQGILDKITGLQQELREIRAEQRAREIEISAFQKEIDMCYYTRGRAARLLNELNGEMQKWRVSETISRENLSNLEGDCLMAAAMVCYLAPFTQKTRNGLYKKWLDKVADSGIAMTPDMIFNSAFCDPLDIKSWLDNGLSNDSYSIENAIILELSALQPILIDPQSQANSWLRKQLPDVKILNIQTTRFLQELKHHIKFGATVIIENVGDYIPRKLYPLFSYAKQKAWTKHPSKHVYIDRQLITIDQNFKMYINSIVSNPDFGSELSLMANFVNFNVTIEAFEAQILALLLQNQESELDQKQKLHRRQTLTWMKQLREVEDVIIREVSRKVDSKTMIDTGILTEKLVQSRVIAKQIGKSLLEIKNAMTFLMRQSRIYKQISVRAAKFFFLVTDLVKLNNMYQFTHEWFLEFFVGQIRKFRWSHYLNGSKGRGNKAKEKALLKLRKKFTKNLYNEVTQTLFERDQILFSFLLAYYEQDSELKCDMRQVEFFIKGNLQRTGQIAQLGKDEVPGDYHQEYEAHDKERDERRAKVAPWISKKTWEALDKLSLIPPFNQPNRQNFEKNLSTHIEANPELWFKYVNDSEIVNMGIHNANQTEEKKQRDRRRTLSQNKLAFFRPSLVKAKPAAPKRVHSPAKADSNPEPPQAASGSNVTPNTLGSGSGTGTATEDGILGAHNYGDDVASSSTDMSADEGFGPADESGGKEGEQEDDDDFDAKEVRALAPSRVLRKLRRVDTHMALSKGIPGNYEDFSYLEAKKVAADLKRTETYIMQKLKIGLAQRILRVDTSQMELDLEKKELDNIFALDLSDDDLLMSQRTSQASTKNLGSDALNSEHELENVEDCYESARKNNVEEDARIAQTIIMGVAEYTEFKVSIRRKHGWRHVEKQLKLDKDLCRLCIMRCFHPDKLMQEIRSFIITFLGDYYLERPLFDFKRFYKATNNQEKRRNKRTPVIFMVGPNVNCLQELNSLIATQPGLDDKIPVQYQPLGSVHPEKIAKLIIRAACQGAWLLLDNLQLSLEIIPNLVRFLQTMYDCETEMKSKLRERVMADANSAAWTRKYGGNNRTQAESALDGVDLDEMDPQDILRMQMKNIIRSEKKLARDRVMQTLEQNELAQQKAEERNQLRELTEEEQCLKDFIFPEKLGMPIHANFRLWLSTIPVENFPIDFARRCTKISLELPTAIRPSTAKSLQTMDEDRLEGIENNKHAFKKMLFATSVMHAVINQRESFGSFGWTQPYFFSPNDLKISLQMLEEVCHATPKSHNLPIQLIQYLIGELNYGGKLINQEDKDILNETVKHFLCQDMLDKSGLVQSGVHSRQYQTSYARKLYDLAVQKIDLSAPHYLYHGKKNVKGADGTMPQRNYLMPVMLDDLQQMQDHVEYYFPILDQPQIFGLHRSATEKATSDLAQNIMFRIYKHQFVIKKPFDMQIDKSDKKRNQVFMYYRQYLQKLENDIPATMDKKLYEDQLPVERSKPFHAFLVKEVQRYNILLNVIVANLQATLAALEGKRAHDDASEDTFECIQTEKTPKEWINHAYPCHLSLPSFIENLKQRVKYIRELCDQFKSNRRQHSAVVRRFWLPGFFNQKNFFTTLIQVVSREDKISYERLQLRYRIMLGDEKVPLRSFGINKSKTFFIYGVWLYGAKWDQNRGTICDLAPNDETGNEIPTIEINVEEFSPNIGAQINGTEEGESHRDWHYKHAADSDSFVTDSSIPTSLDSQTDSQEESSSDSKEYSKSSEQLNGAEDVEKAFLRTHFMCPLYVNFQKNRRTSRFGSEGQLISQVPLRSTLFHPQFWIQRGVCLLCYSETMEEF